MLDTLRLDFATADIRSCVTTSGRGYDRSWPRKRRRSINALPPGGEHTTGMSAVAK